MLIEFTGPSASGKTAFVRHLLKQWPEALSVRLSVDASSSPSRRKFWAAASNLHEFPSSFWHSYNWHKKGLALSKQPLSLSLRMAAEYCLLQGLLKDSRLWLLDQGRLQLGSWLPQQVCDDPVHHARLLKRFVQLGHGVVLISLPQNFLYTRIVQRGDGDRASKIARHRGYSSLRSYCSWVSQQEEEKIKLAMAFGSAVLNIRINDNGEVAETSIHGTGSRYDAALHAIAAAFQSWWDPAVAERGGGGEAIGNK